jgi:hypothetical protein
MRKLGTAAIAAAALLGIAGTAFAQSAWSPGTRQGRVIEVPPGAVVLVLPAGAMPMTPMVPAGAEPLYGPMSVSPMSMPPMPMPPMPMMPMMPDPEAMLRRVHAMMAAAERAFAAPDGAVPVASMPAGPGVSAVYVGSVVSGGQSCTRQVTYDGSGQPKIRVYGNACGVATAPPRPVSLPAFRAPAPAPAVPGMVEARNRTPAAPLPAAPLEIAELH